MICLGHQRGDLNADIEYRPPERRFTEPGQQLLEPMAGEMAGQYSRMRSRSAMRCQIALALRQSLLQVDQRFDDLRSFERFQSLGIFEIDAPREHFDHPLGGLCLKLGRGVTSKHNRRNAALAGLGKDVGRQVIGDSVDTFRDRVEVAGATTSVW